MTPHSTSYEAVCRDCQADALGQADELAQLWAELHAQHTGHAVVFTITSRYLVTS